MGSLFATEGARRRALPPAVRRFGVDQVAEHSPMWPNEIATVCYEVAFPPAGDKPRKIARPLLFGSAVTLLQPKLFGLDSLGESGG